jgi:hypothetical protein
MCSNDFFHYKDATEPDLLILKLNEAGSKANDSLARQHF